MENNAHKVLFILIGLAILAALVGLRPRFQAALLTATRDDADTMRLGDSTEQTDSPSGPAYLVANVPLFFPPPLAHLNPVTSTETGA